MQKQFLQDSGAKYPIIGGPMYPCSNPELVAAVSEAGGIGIVQPLTLTYVEGYDFRAGLRYIRTLTSKPIGMNVLIEKRVAKYQKKMQEWIGIALEEGVRFFITSLGKPDWVVEQVHAGGGKVYHDVTQEKWADVALKSGVDGFIAVNNRAGGHTGTEDYKTLLQVLGRLGLPVVCAGGVSSKERYKEVLGLGYSGVQMGTRFIATKECHASLDYKEAIVLAKEADIVLTEELTGVPVSVIGGIGTEKSDVGVVAGWILKHPKLKHVMRLFYMLRSIKKLKTEMHAQKGKAKFWQAGKSVEEIKGICSVQEIIDTLVT